MKRTGKVRDLVFNPAELATAYVAWAERNASDPGIPFGIPAIDKLVIPMRAGELIAIIARPGHGKSSLMAYLARQTANRFKAAKEDKRVVVYVTWEQSAEELSMFFLANDQHSISDVAWGKANLDEIRRMAVKGVTTPIWVIGHGIGRAGRRAPRMTIDVVLNAIGSMEEDFGVKPGLILADYIQLVPVANARDRMSQVTEVPHLLKELALQIGVPIVAGVQARRDVDDRKIKIPEQRDGQWSSAVEQVSDKVFALWRPALTEDPDEIDSVELLGTRIPINEKLLVIRMLKQRGEQGRATWAMYFDPTYLELAELETLADRLAGRG